MIIFAFVGTEVDKNTVDEFFIAVLSVISLAFEAAHDCCHGIIAFLVIKPKNHY